jgi:hypothetical protein
LERPAARRPAWGAPAQAVREPDAAPG